MVGEAAISLATACYGKDMNGNNGHTNNDVLYIAFAGKDAVPGAKGADWAADSFEEFHKSVSGLGDKLVERLDGDGTSGSGKHCYTNCNGSIYAEALTHGREAAMTSARGLIVAQVGPCPTSPKWLPRLTPYRSFWQAS